MADSVVLVHHDSAVSIASLRDYCICPVRCASCFISCYFVCFDALPRLILYLHAFVYRGCTAHTVPWSWHVFTRSCVHMFTCVVFTLNRLARFGCIGLQCTRRRLFYLLCESCVFKVYVSFFFFHHCYVIMFVHVRPIAEDLRLILWLGTPVDTPTSDPTFPCGGMKSLELMGDNRPFRDNCGTDVDTCAVYV